MNDTPPGVGEAGRDRTGGGDGARRLVPYTQVHSVVRRMLEHLQDVIALLLIALLFVLAVQTLWRLGRLAVSGAATPAEMLSEIMFVLILMELYRLLIFYLREHRISVAMAVEVALVSVLREVMLKGAHEFDALRLMAISLMLMVLGGLLAAERWMRRWQHDARETDAR